MIPIEPVFLIRAGMAFYITGPVPRVDGGMTV